MNRFSGGYGFGGGYGNNFPHNLPVPGNGGGVISNGYNIYSLVSMGLHFLTVIAVLLLIVYIVKRLSKFPFPFSRRTDKALELLNERYARGEIDTEDYVTRKKALGYTVQ